jgi:hypothetical protein
MSSQHNSHTAEDARAGAGPQGLQPSCHTAMATPVSSETNAVPAWYRSVARCVLARAREASAGVRSEGLSHGATQGAHTCTQGRDAALEGLDVLWHRPCIYQRSKTWAETSRLTP